MPRYFLRTKFELRGDGYAGLYEIVSSEQNRAPGDEPVVWSRPYVEGEDCEGRPFPKDVRQKYEELVGKPEFDPNWQGDYAVNLVELVDDEDGSGWNLPCRWAYCVANHSNYCHNDGWLYSPRKCRRGSLWYGDEPFETCPGFAPNPALMKAAIS